MNSLFGFGGVFNSALTTKQAYNSTKRNKNTSSLVKNTPTRGKMNMSMFRSPAMRGMTRKVKQIANAKKNNVYVVSTTEMPELNLSYVKNRNTSVRNKFNEMMVGANLTNPNRPSLTNKQLNARRNVARKMALGQPVSMSEKIQAGIVKLQKPTGPKPLRKTRRNNRK